MAYMLTVLLKKNVSSKATNIFFSEKKKTCELDIVITRTVNILTTNELVNLTPLWTTGPWLEMSIFWDGGIVRFLYSCILQKKLTLQSDFCIYKSWILVHTKPLYSNAKPIAFWRNACILHDTGFCLCVCVEVCRPNQPNGVMSSAVSLPNHTFTGQA